MSTNCSCDRDETAIGHRAFPAVRRLALHHIKTSAEHPWQQEASLNRTQIAAGLLLAVISATAAQAKSSIPTVTNDPLGSNTSATLTPGVSDLINNTPTSSIPAIHHPKGMTPLTVPSDPLGVSIQPAFPGPITAPATGSP
ncbi:hypothetical protein [Mesorhizobium waimense]|uniref:hypothetical protein n=1 Tax=Mesorhizobium waimense TaxID=1300307 RepID=UPI0011C433C2|nr:hypothetical protein [Mesorhizobium waimense]